LGAELGIGLAVWCRSPERQNLYRLFLVALYHRQYLTCNHFVQPCRTCFSTPLAGTSNFVPLLDQTSVKYKAFSLRPFLTRSLVNTFWMVFIHWYHQSWFAFILYEDCDFFFGAALRVNRRQCFVSQIHFSL